MATDPIIELIAKQSMARLDEMESELQQLAQRASFELELVRQAKDHKRGGRSHAIQTTTETPRHVQPRERRNGRSNKTAAIRQILETDPDRPWRPAEISRQLAEMGISLSRDATRVAMNRAGDNFEKLEDGSFKLVTHNGFQRTSPNEAPTSEGEYRETNLLDGSRQGAG